MKIYPARGGVARLPNPQLTKNKDDKLPVMFTFAATHEKHAPNCHDTKNPEIENKFQEFLKNFE